MKQSIIKEYRTEVRSDDEFVDLPEVAVYEIDQATAREIVSLATFVKTHGLYKVEKFDYRVGYFVHDPVADAEGASLAGQNNEVRTDAPTLNVADTEFWFAAYLKHTNSEFLTDHQPISELARHFDIPMPNGSDTAAAEAAPPQPWSMTIPVLSTAHITKETNDLLKEAGDSNAHICCAAYERGFFVYVPGENPPEGAAVPPVDIVALWDWARSRGYPWVRLDADGDVVEGLPTYEW